MLKGLWKYIMHRLEELGPFDYTREVSMPSYETFYPPELAELQSRIAVYVSGILAKEEEIQSELESVGELTDIDEKGKEIEKRLDRKLAEDEAMKTIISECERILKKQPPTAEQNSKLVEEGGSMFLIILFILTLYR